MAALGAGPTREQRVEHATSVHASHSVSCPLQSGCKYNTRGVDGCSVVGIAFAHYHCDVCGKATDRPNRARDHYAQTRKHAKVKQAGAVHVRSLRSDVLDCGAVCMCVVPVPHTHPSTVAVSMVYVWSGLLVGT